MDHKQITSFLGTLNSTKDRNIVIVDFANVDRWQDTLRWPVGLKQLGHLAIRMSYGKKFLRRFYYGEDYGSSDKSKELLPWSSRILTNARYSGFTIVSKRVKYIPDSKYETGFIKKCNLDIEMAIDLIREVNNYDKAIIFSGDGDLACVCKYLHDSYGKQFIFFGARDHIGRELVDAVTEGIINKIVFVEDFEYRLSLYNQVK